jgi:putative transposase
MAMRKEPLITDNYYHVYNRAIHDLQPFLDDPCAIEFTKGMAYYSQTKPPIRLSLRDKLGKDVKDDFNDRLVDILAYCLMPNHFHILLKQRVDGGISNFMRKLQNSFVRYHNLRLKQKGGLFQGNFKSSLITSHEQLLHVSRYIHLNPTSAHLVKLPLEYKHSSLHFYAHNTFTPPFTGGYILTAGESSESYLRFVNSNIVYQEVLQRIKNSLLDTEI